jgi:catechol 2,3-dioxygenase
VAGQGRRIAFLSRDPTEHHQLVIVQSLPQEPAGQAVRQISFRVASSPAEQDAHLRTEIDKLRALMPKK